MSTIPIIHITNTNPILSRKGISYTPSALAFEKPEEARKDRSAKLGRNLNNSEKRKPPMVANKAAFYLDDIRYEGISEAGAPTITVPFKGAKAVIPLVIYDEGTRDKLPWIASGYMGSTDAINRDPACPVKPPRGHTRPKPAATPQTQ